jgi:nucleoredoxin
VSGIPSLVLLTGAGEEITREGRDTITKFGAAAFPFNAEALEAQETQVSSKADALLKQLDENGFFDQATTLAAEKVSRDTLASFETVLLCISTEPNEQIEDIVKSAYEKLQTSSPSKMEVLFVPLGEVEKSTDWLYAPCKGGGGECERLLMELNALDSSHHPTKLLVLGGGLTTVIARDVLMPLYRQGVDAHPWSKERLEEMKQEEKERIAKVRASMAQLQFLCTPARSTLVKNDGSTVPVADLANTDVVALYFSAHWCPPCRGFTPELVKIHEELTSAGKSFQVVFVSSDRDEEAFKEYFAEMPWLALPYEEVNTYTYT